MAKRSRSSGEGTIFPEKKDGKKTGKWKAALTVGWIGGKRRRKTKICKSQADAKAALLEMRSELSNEGPICDPDKLTLGQFLIRWLEDTIKPQRSENTYTSYRIAITKHIAPLIGSLRLRSVAPMHVQNLLAELLRLKVGDRTRANCYAILSSAMTSAVNLHLLRSNPCSPIERPAYEREAINPFSLAETQKIIKETVGDPYHPMYVVALTTGLRQGELAGLIWSDIDFKAKTVSVQRQATEISGKVVIRKPKSKSSVRTVPLPDVAITALSSHRAAMLKVGRAGARAVVFQAPEGGHIRRSTFARRQWGTMLDRLGLSARGMHHARHTFACLSLEAGVAVDVLSKWMGHHKPSVTLDIYAHRTKSRQDQAISRLDRFLA